MIVDSMPAFDRFVRRAHARYVVLRTMERMGLGILAGCAVMTTLLPFLWLQGPPLLPITVGALIVGGLVGLVWGIAARPTWLDTAMEADVQLDLADLLGTALQLRHAGIDRGDQPRDPWQLAVSATAEARCRELSPASVILNRLGARAWGGIGLATALVLAIGMIGTRPDDSHAAQSPALAAPSTPSSQAAPELSDRPLLSAVSPSDLPPAERDNDSAANREGSIVTPAPPASDSAAITSVDSRRKTSPGQPDGGTSGSSRTDSHPQPVDPTAPQASANVDRRDPSSANANPTRSASGVGPGRSPSEAAARPAQSPSATGTVSPNAALHSTPPWTSDHWTADIRSARHELEAGQVPASYRVIVRKYFEQP